VIRHPTMSAFLLFVPAFARNEVSGVLVVQSAVRLHAFTDEEQAARSTWPTRSPPRCGCRTSRPCASSFSAARNWPLRRVDVGVADELRSPLEAIEKTAAHFAERLPGRSRERLDKLMAESRRAVRNRAACFVFPERSEIQQFDVTDLLASALKFPNSGANREPYRPALAFLGAAADDHRIALSVGTGVDHVPAPRRARRRTGSPEETDRFHHPCADRAVLEISWSCLPELLEPDVFEHQPGSGC